MQVAAWMAAGLVYLSFFMKTIVPLRSLAILSNVVFIVYALLGIRYGVFDKVLPILVLHVALLPLNVTRLLEVKKTIRAFSDLKESQASLGVLIPYMKRENKKQGQTLFTFGDPANELYLLHAGRIALPEVSKVLGAGAMFGEVGIFSESAKRTTSAICETDCVLLSISREKVLELFYMDTRFGLFIVRLLSGYLTQAAGLPASKLTGMADPEQQHS